MPARARRRLAEGWQGGQSMVEFALLAPLLVLIVLLAVDFGRLIYTFGAISYAAREGSRLASLEPQKTTDCPILQRIEQVAQGFPLAPDPNSVAGNTDPNAPSGTRVPTTPPAGQGYIYIYPAVAPTTPQDTNCVGAPRKNSSQSIPVSVQIQFTYQPLVPLFASFIPTFTIKTISVVPTEY